jgi:REP element-mobilizing transposase RayT
MILASHTILSAYGFWLPNDPRGSWSTFVGSWELLRFGEATKVATHRSVARVPHDRQLRLRAKEALKHPPVRFTGKQAFSIAKGFAQALKEGGYVLYACAILPDHVHLVIASHSRPFERIAGHLKSAATRQLDADGLHPFPDAYNADGTRQSPWGERAWHVFLDSHEDIVRAVRYVESNPVREGKRVQRWSFVTEYAKGTQ